MPSSNINKNYSNQHSNINNNNVNSYNNHHSNHTKLTTQTRKPGVGSTPSSILSNPRSGGVNNIHSNHSNHGNHGNNPTKAYEYKSPYKPQIRPNSAVNPISSVNPVNQVNRNRLMDQPEHKILVQPIKIVESSKRVPSANMNSYNLHNPNNFLKGNARPSDNKLINHVARPVHLYRK